MVFVSDPSSHDPHPESDDWSTVAGSAARSVIRHFGGPLLGIPGTHLAAVQRPGSSSNPTKPFHYWWQAHYIDALIDAGWRELRTGERVNGPQSPSAGQLASTAVKTLKMRNFFRIINSYYDDMAWMALAVERLDRLAQSANKPGSGNRIPIHKALTRKLLSAATTDLEGGLFWNTKHDFKNTAATAPAALYLARRSIETPRFAEQAQLLLDWLESSLLDERGLYLDGIRIIDGAPVKDHAVYTYNQGPVIGALLTLGGEENLARVTRGIDAIKSHLTEPKTHILRTEGTGDGGLFTGILCRYLALAALDPRLPETSRARAARLVTSTATALWEGRCERWAQTRIIGKPERVLLFPRTPSASAAAEYPAGEPVELSTQVAAWMIFEAAATIEEGSKA